MQTKLVQFSSWFVIHRTQVQVVLFLVLLGMALVTIAAPGVVAFADGTPPGLH